MGLFGKIKEILFDEETVEIPVITKEEKADKQKEKVKSKVKEPSRVEKNNDEVIIRRIDTPKRETVRAEDLFDMPKFKEEVKEEKKANSFSFPVFDDNEEIGEVKEPRREKRSSKSINLDTIDEAPKRTKIAQKKNEERTLGYTNAYDYSYGKYKGDYKTSRESNHSVITKTVESRDEHTTFTPSPIISPVYGVLNENYKKEDIVTRTSTVRSNRETLDLDSVRRKAYGTLEDDIENSLDKTPSYLEEIEENEDEYLEDDETGISIDDLLVRQDEEALEEINDHTSEIELFNVGDKTQSSEFDMSASEPQEEIDLSDEELPKEELIDEEIELEETNDSIIVVEDEDMPKEKKVPKASSLKNKDVDFLDKENDKESEEEDLFDLIDSLYDGKGEE